MRKALLGGNIAIIVNDSTNQQISSATMYLQRVGTDTYIGPYLNR
jgi:hypothetical protein